MEWEAVIGLEVHVSLSTKTKLFSGTASVFGAEPNTEANIFDLAMPGTLPVLNEEALRMAVKFGLAIGAEIGKRSVFDRKNYFYPDLPKGYQVTQLDFPTVGRGSLTIALGDGSEKQIGITRAHIEENAGKSLHEDFHGMSGIDLNRSGEPLLEIVSEPAIRSAKEAVAYLKKLHAIVRYLDISDAIMAQGSMRCDVNVSIRPKGSSDLGTRTEMKNLNSFRFVEKAINSEIQRQQISWRTAVPSFRRPGVMMPSVIPARPCAARNSQMTIVTSRSRICCQLKSMTPISMRYGPPCQNYQMPKERVL